MLLPLSCWGGLVLRDNLSNASVGDYIVTAQNKVCTMLLITDIEGREVQIDEITIPLSRVSKQRTWREWFLEGAPNHSSWVRYKIDLDSARMINMYSLTKGTWYSVDEADNFLSKLLNLHLERIPERQRKRVGPRLSPDGGDTRKVWQPRMMVDGTVVPDVEFAAYRTYWPKDQSELSGKGIEIYVPEESTHYPSYFPYWLQISGFIGKARVRIVDSGVGLVPVSATSH